jgi:hypothetical protein
MNHKRQKKKVVVSMEGIRQSNIATGDYGE